MARKPQKTENVSSAVTDEDTPGLPAAMQDLALSVDLEKADILNAGIDLGRIDALSFIATVADSAILAIYENSKKTKAWMFLKNCDGRNFENLEQFCEEKLGHSYRRLQEISSNRKALGQEAFEHAERIGLRQRDYNLIKALPAPKQEIIKEALAENASKEELQKAIRELAVADQKEIDTLAKRAEEAEANLVANQEVSDKKTKKIDELETQLAKKKRIPRASPDEEGAELRQEVALIAYTAEVEVRGNLKNGFEALLKHTEEHGISHTDFMAGLCCQILEAVYQLREIYNIPDAPEGGEMPDWLRPGATEKAVAKAAEDMAAAGWKYDENGKMVRVDSENV